MVKYFKNKEEPKKQNSVSTIPKPYLKNSDKILTNTSNNNPQYYNQTEPNKIDNPPPFNNNNNINNQTNPK